MKILGCDPSERHTGLVVLNKGHQPSFDEIYTHDMCVIEAIEYIRNGLETFFKKHNEPGDEWCFAVEKQLPVGGQSSALLFYVYMAVLEQIYQFTSGKNVIFVSPLPNQLKSYIKKQYGIETGSKSAIVKGWQEKTKYPGRISSHKVEAWFLARLARDVLEGRWEYKLPSKEAPLVPWVTLNGANTGSSTSRG